MSAIERPMPDSGKGSEAPGYEAIGSGNEVSPIEGSFNISNEGEKGRPLDSDSTKRKGDLLVPLDPIDPERGRPTIDSSVKIGSGYPLGEGDTEAGAIVGEKVMRKKPPSDSDPVTLSNLFS